MKILVMSDLHLEFMKDRGRAFLNQPWPHHDVCVIAGDLSSFKYLAQSIQRCANVFPQIVYVSGNHECYGSSLVKVKELFHYLEIDNFHYINNSYCVIEGQRFIGGTMWFPQELDIRNRKYLGDFHAIKDIHNIYIDNSLFKDTLSQVKFDDIVVTHHLPSNQSVPLKYKNDPINCYFVNDVSNHIMYHQPKLWIHGHTHSNMDYTIGETRIVCNPLGYPGENPDFKRNFVIDTVNIATVDV